MARQVIAVDLGGTNVRAGVVSESGQILFHIARPTSSAAGPAVVMAEIAEVVAEARRQATAPLPVIGVSAPGPLDTLRGVALTMQSLAGFDGFPLKSELEQALGGPVLLENDGIAGAIGEWRFGAGRGLGHMVYVTLSTGIGGGIIADGRPLRGRSGLAGHVGHIFFTAPWQRHPGGTMTCFEDYASASALGHRARREIGDEPRSALAGAAPLDAAAIVRAAEAGDAFAARLLDDEARAVGLGLASLVHVLNPERIVLGGGLALGLPRIAGQIAGFMEEQLKPGFGATPVVLAELGGHSCLVGAAALALSPDLSG
jgi:glucokinase